MWYLAPSRTNRQNVTSSWWISVPPPCLSLEKGRCIFLKTKRKWRHIVSESTFFFFHEKKNSFAFQKTKSMDSSPFVCFLGKNLTHWAVWKPTPESVYSHLKDRSLAYCCMVCIKFETFFFCVWKIYRF